MIRCSFSALLFTFLFCSCGSQHFRVPTAGPPRAAPRYVQLNAETQVATLHFPPGLYSFYAMDDKGYYYRAPRSIIQHTGGRSLPRNGGIFVDKRSLRKLRGYIYYAGALTHVGDLSKAHYAFGDQ